MRSDANCQRCGRPGVPGSLDGITLRDSGLDLNSVSTLRSPPLKLSAAKDHREASISMNISSCIEEILALDTTDGPSGMVLNFY